MSYTVILIGPFKQEAEKFLNGFGPEFILLHTPTAQEGYAAIEREKKKHGITVLLDLHVEDEDGLDVLDTIKTKYPIVEVIALSPKQDASWAITTMRLGGYAFEPYWTETNVIARYLSQILDQFDIFKIAQSVCQEKLIDDMDIRFSLALEFLMKRRYDGSRLTKEDLSLFFSISDTNHKELHNQLQNLESAYNKPARILLVEDEAEVATSLYDILVGLLKYELEIVPKKADALALIEKDNGFHVAILDIGLPDGKGMDLIAPILAASPDTEIVMLTAFDDTFHITNSFQLGASDYIPKPFDPYHLQQVISKAAQRYVYKSFLPTASWLDLSTTEDNPDLRRTLLNEFVAMRREKNKPILDQELAVFKVSRDQIHL